MEDFSKAPLFVRLGEHSSPFVGSHGICEERQGSHGQGAASV